MEQPHHGEAMPLLYNVVSLVGIFHSHVIAHLLYQEAEADEQKGVVEAYKLVCNRRALVQFLLQLYLLLKFGGKYLDSCNYSPCCHSGAKLTLE